MRPFRELRVWRDAHELTLQVYGATRSFPKEEVYGLTSQTRRAAASVPANIAEGSVRSDAEFRQFLRVALGSATELDYHLILARDLGYLSEDVYVALENRVASLKRMLTVFIQRVDHSVPVRSGAYGLRPTADGGAA